MKGANFLWIMAGDFNCVRYDHEKIGGDVSDFFAIEEFNNCLMEAKLNDLKWWGQKFS